jgi:soluble lytic murein transglycosylase-like protein
VGGCLDPGHEALVARVQDLLLERMPRAVRPIQQAVARAIARETGAVGIDPLLVLAVIEVESGFDPSAISEAGARGLMQLLPGTLQREAELLGLVVPADPNDPVVNVRAGVRYLRRCMDSFPGRVELALMAYNSGPNRVLELVQGGAPPGWALAFPRRVEEERHRLRLDGGLDAAPRVADARDPR